MDFTFLLAKTDVWGPGDQNKKTSGLGLNISLIINLLESGLREKKQ